MKEKIDSHLLPAFCNSAVQTFETMVFMPLTCGKTTEKGPNGPCGAISGTIGLSGDIMCGSLSVIFTRPIINKIFKSMMMSEDEPNDDGELKDMVGELANMVAGGAKAALQGQGIHFVIGLPTVVVGENHYLNSPEIAASRVVEMTIDAGTFYMELAVM